MGIRKERIRIVRPRTEQHTCVDSRHERRRRGTIYRAEKMKKLSERPTSCSFIIPMLSHQDGIAPKYFHAHTDIWDGSKEADLLISTQGKVKS